MPSSGGLLRAISLEISPVVLLDDAALVAPPKRLDISGLQGCCRGRKGK